MAYKTAEERKSGSEKYLENLGFKVNHYLPLVGDQSNAKFQSARNIAIRTQILGALAETTFELSRSECRVYFQSIGIWEHVSPTEQEYLTIDEPEAQTKIDLSWRIEANYVLFWSLGYVDKLATPIEPIELHDIHERIQSEISSAEEFFQSARLRNSEEILDECDLIYRLHNSVRNSVFNNEKIPNEYHPSIVYERHYALNWITCYQDEWDEITTDT